MNWNETRTTGTVHVALKTAGGVVMVSDSRTSGGAFIASPVTNKITQLGPKLFLGRAGTASHTQHLAHLTQVTLAEIRLLTPNIPKEVTAAANFIGSMMQQHKDRLSGAFLLGGWDEEGGHLFDISVSGFVIPRKISAIGSGSVYIAAFIDANYREDFTLEEATDFAVQAVALAIARDGACGGVINVVQITESGVKRKALRPASHPVDDRKIIT